MGFKEAVHPASSLKEKALADAMLSAGLTSHLFAKNCCKTNCGTSLLLPVLPARNATTDNDSYEGKLLFLKQFCLQTATKIIDFSLPF
jgi:hypothetical protein